MIGLDISHHLNLNQGKGERKKRFLFIGITLALHCYSNISDRYYERKMERKKVNVFCVNHHFIPATTTYMTDILTISTKKGKGEKKETSLVIRDTFALLYNGISDGYSHLLVLKVNEFVTMSLLLCYCDICLLLSSYLARWESGLKFCF